MSRVDGSTGGGGAGAGGSITIGDNLKLNLSSDGKSYLIYDTATSSIQLWVNDIKRSQWT